MDSDRVVDFLIADEFRADLVHLGEGFDAEYAESVGTGANDGTVFGVEVLLAVETELAVGWDLGRLGWRDEEGGTDIVVEFI